MTNSSLISTDLTEQHPKDRLQELDQYDSVSGWTEHLLAYHRSDLGILIFQQYLRSLSICQYESQAPFAGDLAQSLLLQHSSYKILLVQNVEMLPTDPVRYSTDPILAEYLLSICDQLGFKISTLSLAIDILCRYSSITSSSCQSNPQLASLVCLFLASKLNEVDFMLLTQVHKFSNHSFTNKQILALEQRILQKLDFKLICRDTSFHEYVEVLSEICLAFLPVNVHADFTGVVQLIQKLLLKQSSTCLQVSCSVLPAAILVSALVVISQSNGRFPMTCRLAKICKVEETDIQAATLKVLKIVLGRDLYKSLDLE